MQRDDVRVIQSRCEANFLEKSVRPEDRRDLGMQNLERDRPIVSRVVSTLHDRHPSAADFFFYPVAAAEKDGFRDWMGVGHGRL
jgi:hypothetical protein